MKETCIIVTWLPQDQPGFLDFSYRVRSLASQYDTLLVSHYPLTHPEFAIDGVRHCVLPHDEGRKGWLAYLLACARLIRRERPSCAVLLHSMLAPMALLTGATPTALYWNEHPSRFTASPPDHPWHKRLARTLALKLFFMDAAKRCTLVMPIGEAHEDDLLRIGCRRERVKRIYMGVDASFLNQGPRRREHDDAPLELVYNGTVNALRGRDVMLEGVALANKTGQIARLTIVGASADELDYCKQYAQRLGIADAVTIRGRIPGSDMPALLAGADAGLCFMEDLPWWRFNPPTKLFEYLVAGLPVLASDIRTHTQYVRDWDNGLVCRYASKSLAERIVELWQRRRELNAFKARARQSGEQYLWGRIEPEFLQSIHTIARPRRAVEHARGKNDGLRMEQARPAESARGKP